MIWVLLIVAAVAIIYFKVRKSDSFSYSSSSSAGKFEQAKDWVSEFTEIHYDPIGWQLHNLDNLPIGKL